LKQFRLLINGVQIGPNLTQQQAEGHQPAGPTIVDWLEIGQTVRVELNPLLQRIEDTPEEKI
jgi:hypothetical protein